MIHGIVLCAGAGSRLKPLTDAVKNKHLLPIGDKPAICYPMELLVNSGISEIMMVCNSGDMFSFIRNGERFGLRHVAYGFQAEPKGIADALSICEAWAKDSPVCVILGDNILLDDISQLVADFNNDPSGACILLTEVDNPSAYGVVTVNDSGEVVRIVEKPANPESNSISIGIYLYDSTVWDRIRQLSPSARAELEITDLNNLYLKDGKLKAHKIKGLWLDIGGSVAEYVEANIKLANHSH